MSGGLLAIYPVNGSPEQACERAFGAVLETLGGLEALNVRRAAGGAEKLARGSACIWGRLPTVMSETGAGSSDRPSISPPAWKS